MRSFRSQRGVVAVPGVHDRRIPIYIEHPAGDIGKQLREIASLPGFSDTTGKSEGRKWATYVEARTAVSMPDEDIPTTILRAAIYALDLRAPTIDRFMTRALVRSYACFDGGLLS